MNSNRYSSDGKVSGGFIGSLILGVIIALFFNIIVAPGTRGDSPTSFRIVFAFLSFANIPIAIIGQIITQKVFTLFFSNTRIITKKMTDIMYRRYLGAILFPAIYDTSLIYILYKIFY